METIDYDNAVKEETQDWVTLAETDLAAVGALLEKELYSPAIFHCQQAIEKMLKAIWVEVRDEMPPRTHNLVELAQELGLLDDEVLLRTLTSQALVSRYKARHHLTKAQAQDFYARTTEACEQLRQRLK